MKQREEAQLMFRGFSIFIPTQGYSQHHTNHGARSLGWRLMAPGLGLICAALAMVIWPELLAYFVASLLLCGGTVLLMLGWRMRQLEQPARRHKPTGPPFDFSDRED
jgi:peptidoglycan/LPS O-acetylase OafA/YrhL